MDEFNEIDYFTDPSIVDDPFQYFERLRSSGPVHYLPQRNVMAVTGYEEAVRVYNDPKTFSSIVSVGGPIPPLPFQPVGEDITPQIEQHRSEFAFSQLVATMDDERHAVNRSLLLRLFTPSRLRANETYMRRIADEHIDRFITSGKCEFYSEYSHSFAGLVIADLLGIPENDRSIFWAKRQNMTSPSSINPNAGPRDFHQLVAEYFRRYLEERRQSPGRDILSEFAQAKKPDGQLHSIDELVNVGVILFGAGQGTTAHFMATSMKILAENGQLQRKLRDNPGMIPDFIEEALRYEGPIKNTFRLARRQGRIDGVDIPAGTCVMLANAALNRDPRQYVNPQGFELGRPHGQTHLAFGRGPHTCPGAALARTEMRISLEHILARLDDIKISDSAHGPSGSRRFTYEPTYLLRGLRHLHLEFKPA